MKIVQILLFHRYANMEINTDYVAGSVDSIWHIEEVNLNRKPAAI